MSLQTWKNEFYPIPADKCRKKDAVVHSLRKWIGFRQENLARHGIATDDIEYAHLDGGKSCALCFFYRNTKEECGNCPLFVARGGWECFLYSSRYDIGLISCYASYTRHGNPEPMIAFLEKALAE